jgi:putative ABC transport system permease protein
MARHAVSAIIMALTVAIIMVFASVIGEVMRYMQSSSSTIRVSVAPKLPVGAWEFPMSLHARLQAISGVQKLQRTHVFSGRHESGATYQVAGEELVAIESLPDVYPVTADVIDAWNKDRIGAIVTESTANDLRLSVGQTAEVPTLYGPVQLKVIAITKNTKVPNRIALHFDYVEELMKKPGRCGYRLMVDANDYERVSREIEELTKNSGEPATVISEAQLFSTWMKQAAAVPVALGFLGIFLLFTTALTLANSSAIAIRERRTEIGTMRVLGFHDGTVVGLLLLEVALVGLVGGLLATVVVPLVFGDGMRLAPSTLPLLQNVQIGPLGIVCGLITSVAIPIVGTLPSARAAVRMDLSSCLRGAA